MNIKDKEKWDKIIQNHIPCTCGEIYLSRNLTAPDCPYHSNDWESPMEEFLNELKEYPSGKVWDDIFLEYSKSCSLELEAVKYILPLKDWLNKNYPQKSEAGKVLQADAADIIKGLLGSIKDCTKPPVHITNRLNDAIDDAEQFLDAQPHPYNLEDSIKKASENWGEIDPDKFLSEIRG